MSRQLLLRYLPVLLLAILLTEIALSWWPWEELYHIQSGNRMYGPPMRMLHLHIFFGTRFLTVFLVCLVVAFYLLRISTPKIPLPFPRIGAISIVAIGSYVIGQFLWLATMDYKSMMNYQHLKLFLVLIFKISAVVVLYGAMRHKPYQRAGQAWANTVPAEQAATVKPGPTFRTTVAVSLVVYLLLPLWELLFNLATPLGFISRVPSGIDQLGKFVTSVVLAFFMLKIGTATGVFLSKPDPWQAKYSWRLLLVFSVLAPIAAILSAIPYGGGNIPPELRLVVSAAQLLGVWALYSIMNKRANSN